MGRYADYIPGTLAVEPSSTPERGDRSEGRPRILCREPDGRWTLRHSGDGPAVHTSGEPTDDPVEAVRWADDLIGTGSGTWTPVDKLGPVYHLEGGRWAPDDGPVYRWEPDASL